MSESTIHNTFVVERAYPVAPDRVFAALADPVKKRRWFGEGPMHDVEEFAMDFRVGGAERLRYRFKNGTPFPGVVVDNDGIIHDIVTNERIVTASAMVLGGKRISVTLVTIELSPTAEGTTLICTHQGTFFEGADGPQIREMGWRALFEKLAAELLR
jgi:uncharacterized protein YndB with AHSA1/START domain